MKIKLNLIQRAKLLQAVQRENAYKQQFNTVRIQFSEATKTRQDIFEMICDAAGVNPKDFNDEFQIREDEIILTEKGKTTSDRIRNEIKKVKPTAKAKVK